MLQDNSTLENEPVSSFLIKTIVSAFTILTAFSIRDTITDGLERIAPNDASKKYVYSVAVTMMFLFITIVLAWQYQEFIE